MLDKFTRRFDELENFRSCVANDHWLKYGGIHIWASNLEDEETSILANLNVIASSIDNKDKLEEFSKICSDFLHDYIKFVETYQ